jgi:phosphoglycolate phosphatase
VSARIEGVDIPARPPATVLLDLDGTLIDSAPGILGSLAAAFAELGIPLPDGGLPRTLLGPPLYRSLPPLVGTDRAPEMLAAYRRIYNEVGVRECLPFDGIEALLHDLAAAGATLAVATSKAEVYANKIVEQRSWTDLFATVCGDTLDADRPTKADVVGEALRRLGNPTDVIMVGDRLHDVEGARVHGLGCLGAAWGYAAPGELEEAGALAVYPDPASLGAALHGAGTAPSGTFVA